MCRFATKWFERYFKRQTHLWAVSSQVEGICIGTQFDELCQDTAIAKLARRRSDSAYGARATPRSQIIAEIRRAGVTSNAGFATATSGAIRIPNRCVTSSAERSSMGI